MTGTRGDADLIVIGAGFAGLSAARAAARAGARLLGLEAKAEIGATLHTTGIYVQEAFEADPPPAALLRRVEKVRLYGPDRKAKDFAGSGYAFYTTDTPGVLRWMAEEARAAGAEIRLGAPLQAGYQAEGRVEIVAGGRPFTGYYLLGADGARSRTAQIFGLGRNRRFLAGVERHYESLGALEDDRLHVILDSRAAPGYVAWACASPCGAQAGLAVSAGRKPQIEGFLAEVEARFGLDRSQATEWRAGLIPCGGLVHPWQKGVVGLVGDAAGMVSPLTAGGIRTALVHGREYGEAIGAWFAKAGPPPRYAMLGKMPRFGSRHLLRWVMDAPPPNWMLQRVVDASAAAFVVRRMFFGRSP